MAWAAGLHPPERVSGSDCISRVDCFCCLSFAAAEVVMNRQRR